MAASYQIYRNLNNHHPAPWSLRYRGLVVDHPFELVAFGVRLHTGESTRRASVARGVRSVHAWAVCERITRAKPAPGQFDGDLRYDWQTGQWTDRDTGEELPDTLAALYFESDGRVQYRLR